MSEFWARAAAAFLFVFLFVGGPAVLALGGAALGGVGGATGEDYWSISVNADAGNVTGSIEFVDSDCTTFNAGTHPSGWARGSTFWGGPVEPYVQFYDAGFFLGDCGDSRPGSYNAQPGVSNVDIAVAASISWASDFTLYAKVARRDRITNGQGALASSLGLIVRGPLTGGNANTMDCTMRANAAGNAWEALAQRVANGVLVTSTAIAFNVQTFRPSIVLLQKSGTTGRCWFGGEDGTFYPIGEVAGVPATVGTLSAQVRIGNIAGASYPMGTPSAHIDYIRLVNGNGSYLP